MCFEFRRVIVNVWNLFAAFLDEGNGHYPSHCVLTDLGSNLDFLLIILMWLKEISIHSMEYDIPQADQIKGMKVPQLRVKWF